MLIVKTGRRGQVTLPRAIRRAFKLKEGDHIAFVLHGERVILQPLTQTLLDMRGSVPVSAPQGFSTIRQQAIAGRVRRAAQDER